MWVGSLFDTVTIDLGKSELEIKFYLTTGPDTKIEVTFADKITAKTSGGTELKFSLKDVQIAKLFEYLVFYPFFASFPRDQTTKRTTYIPMYILKKTGFNRDYFTHWPSGDASNFANLASYIKWWQDRRINYGGN